MAYGDEDFNDPQMQRLAADVRKLQLLSAQNQLGIDGLRGTVASLHTSITGIIDTQISLPAAPAANLLWNGELGHSVNSWNDAAYTIDDKSKECAWFFSHKYPFTPQAYTAIAVADTIPLPAHGMVTGQAIRNTTSGVLPTGLVAGTVYFVIVVDANNIKLATTYANSLANTPTAITVGTGAGTHTIGAYLDPLDARTTSINHALKNSSHSTYSLLFSAWNSARGHAQMMGTDTLATPLPGNFLEPGLFAHTSFVCARRTPYIELTESMRIIAGIWDSTLGQDDFLKGAVGLTATPIPIAGSVTERRYRLFVQTDRGYSILSPEVAVVNGWSDAEFATGKAINLTWLRSVGILSVQVWRFTPSTGVYALLEEISSGTTTYIDNNSFLRTDVGYPTSINTERKALFVSDTGNIVHMAVDPAVWDTFHAPIYVPDNYNKALTTDRQWLIIALNTPPNLYVPGCTTTGTTTLTAPAGVFEAAYQTLFPGLTIEIYDPATGALVTTKTISAWTDATHVVMSSALAAGTHDVRVVGGGFHGVLIDKVHVGFQSNVSFAPNPLDARVLQPVAAPSSGTGGVGTGDGGGGGVICVVGKTPIQMRDSRLARSWVAVEKLEKHTPVQGENIRPNRVRDVSRARGRPRLVVTKNGLWKRCSNSHRFRASATDETGTPLFMLRLGDCVMTNLDGRDELSPIAFIGELEDTEILYWPHLESGHYYIAGEWKANWRQKILIRLRLMKPKSGGIYAHNDKPPLDD